MSEVAFFWNSKDKDVKRFRNKNDCKVVFLDPNENEDSYLKFLSVKEVYGIRDYVQDTLRDAIWSEDSTHRKIFNIPIGEPLFLNAYYYLSSVFIYRSSVEMVLNQSTEKVYISKRIPGYVIAPILSICDLEGIKYSEFGSGNKNLLNYKTISLIIAIIIKPILHLLKSLIKKMTFRTFKSIFLIQNYRADLETVLYCLKGLELDDEEYAIICSDDSISERLDELPNVYSLNDFYKPIKIFSIIQLFISNWNAMRGYFLDLLNSFDMSIKLRNELLNTLPPFSPYHIASLLRIIILEKEMIKTLNPLLIINGSAMHPWAKVMTHLAKYSSVTTAVLQHGVTADKIGYIPQTADYFFAWGQYSADWMVKNGLNRDKIIITGSPKYEYIQEELREVNRVNDDGHFVYTFFTSNFPDVERKKYIELSEKTLEKFDDITIRIKPHPAENISFYESFIEVRGNSNLKIMDKNLPVYKALDGTDAVIIPNSGVGIEAFIAGFEVIFLNIRGEEELIPYSEFGSVLEANDVDSFYEAVKVVKNEEVELSDERENFLRNYLNGLSGNSWGIIEEFIREQTDDKG